MRRWWPFENGDYLWVPRGDAAIADVGANYDRVKKSSFPMKLTKHGTEANCIQEAYLKHGRMVATSSACRWKACRLCPIRFPDDNPHEPLRCVAGVTIRKRRGSVAAAVLPTVVRELVLTRIFFHPKPRSFSVAAGMSLLREYYRRLHQHFCIYKLRPRTQAYVYQYLHIQEVKP